MVVYTYLFRLYTVNYTDIKKVRAYMRKKATQGFTIDSVFGMGDESVLITLAKGNHVSYTPGFQYACIHHDHIYAYGTTNSCKNWSGQISIPEPEPTPVKFGVRTIKNGIVTDWTTFEDELDARTHADCNVQSDWTGETTASIIPIMSDGSLGGIIDRIVYIDPNDGDDWIDSDDDDDDDEPEPTTTDTPITRVILETLDKASQNMKGWISMEMNDGRTVCTDGNDVWFADVGNRVPIDSINLTDTFVSIRFPNDEGVMWLYYEEMVNASLTITGVN